MFSLFKKEKRALGIDIGAHSMKLVQLRKSNGKLILEDYAALVMHPFFDGYEEGQTITNPNEETLFTMIQHIFKENKGGFTAKSVGFSVQAKDSFIKVLDIPPVSDDKVPQIVGFEIRRIIPISIENISYQHIIIPEVLFEREDKPIFEDVKKSNTPEKEKGRKILIIAILNRAIEMARSFILRSGLNLEITEPEVLSTIRSINLSAPFLLVDLGGSQTKLYIVDHSIPVLTIGIDESGDNISKAIAQNEGISLGEAERKKIEQGFNMENKETIEKMRLITDSIFTYANNLIREHETKFHKSVHKVYFTGGGSAMIGIKEEANKILNLDIEIINPFARVEYPPYMTDDLTLKGGIFTPAIGAAIRVLE